jgi:hypothetical protein
MLKGSQKDPELSWSLDIYLFAEANLAQFRVIE